MHIHAHRIHFDWFESIEGAISDLFRILENSKDAADAHNANEFPADFSFFEYKFPFIE